MNGAYAADDFGPLTQPDADDAPSNPPPSSEHEAGIRLADDLFRNGDDVCYWNDAKQWARRDPVSGVWRADNLRTVERDAGDLISKWTQDSTTPPTRKRLRSLAFRTGALRFASERDGVSTRRSAFDNEPYLLGTPGGIYDLRDSRIATGTHAVSRQTSVAPDLGSATG